MAVHHPLWQGACFPSRHTTPYTPEYAPCILVRSGHGWCISEFEYPLGLWYSCAIPAELYKICLWRLYRLCAQFEHASAYFEHTNILLPTISKYRKSQHNDNKTGSPYEQAFEGFLSSDSRSSLGCLPLFFQLSLFFKSQMILGNQAYTLWLRVTGDPIDQTTSHSLEQIPPRLWQMPISLFSRRRKSRADLFSCDILIKSTQLSPGKFPVQV